MAGTVAYLTAAPVPMLYIGGQQQVPKGGTMAAEDSMLRVSRRSFVQAAGVAGLGLLGGGGRLAGQAPATPKVYRLGYFNPQGAAVGTPRLEALQQGLR